MSYCFFCCCKNVCVLLLRVHAVVVCPISEIKVSVWQRTQLNFSIFILWILRVLATVETQISVSLLINVS